MSGGSFLHGVRVSTAEQGGAKVFDNFGVTLGQIDDQGNPSKPGILIKNGAMENVNVAMNGTFALAGLTVTPKGLRVDLPVPPALPAVGATNAADPPISYRQTVKVDSVARVPNSSDVTVTYTAAARGAAAAKVVVGVYIEQGPGLPLLPLDRVKAVPFAAGPQTITIPNADLYYDPDLKLVLGVTVEDDSFSAPAFSALATSALPPSAANPLTLTAPAAVTFDPGTTVAFAPGTIQVGDALAAAYPDSIIDVYLDVNSGMLTVPALPASVTETARTAPAR